MGLTSASFHESGTILSNIDALKISATGEESSIAKSFKIQLCKLLEPEALQRLRLESIT